MNKLKFIILTLASAVSILFLVSPASAAPNAPAGFTAVNFGGPIRLAWTASTGGVGTVTYTIYRVEADSTTIPTPVAPGANGYGSYAQTVTFGITSTSYIDTSVIDGTIYYYFVTGNDTTGESNPASNVSSATSDYPEADLGYYMSLSATETTIGYETSTLANPSTGTVITYTITDTDQAGNRFVAAKINYDIIDNFTEASIYKETQEISGSSGGINTGQITWDGRWFNTIQYTKHNGSYTVEVWATDFAGTDHPKVLITITVHVVHVNDIVQTFTDFGATTIAHSLPIHFSYQLTQAAWTTITIYNTNGTVTTADDTLVKRFTYTAPRNGEGQDRSFREYQTWDGTDSNNKLVPAGIYRFAIDAYFDHTGVTDRDTADSRGWTFALDKRIVDITANAITPDEPVATLKYTISEPAFVKIKICKPGTTFSIDPVTGEAVPNPLLNLVKTFTSYKISSGEQSDVWDGRDENSKSMDNGLYLMVITAKDAEGNYFFSDIGTDNLFRSTIPIGTTNQAGEFVDNVNVDFKETVFVYPNPVKGSAATFAYTIIAPATVTVDVFTILGEKIWSKIVSDGSAGIKKINWDCTNNDGNTLADELYLYRITAEYSNGNTKSTTKKLIISK